MIFLFRTRLSRPRKEDKGGEKETYRHIGDLDHLSFYSDLTETAGPGRVQRHPNEAEFKKYSEGNWRIRNMDCWRPLVHAANERPLAMCDFFSVNKEDLIWADRASREYVGEIYYIHYDYRQRWYWVSRQLPEEILLLSTITLIPGRARLVC